MGRTLENVFSWSRSRAATFERCARAYWWQYYGSWGGWERQAPAEARQAYVLKNLTSRWAWVGNAVHEQIERVLTRIRDRGVNGRLPLDGERPDTRAELESMTQKMRRQYRQSRKGEYRDRPKKAFGLMEHEYEDPIPDDEWRETSRRARRALQAFLESDVFARILDSDPARWLPFETLGQFQLDGVGVWAVPDFAWRVDDDAVEIYDWKTGRPDPERGRLQMACYTLYAESKYGVDAERVRSHLVYLGEDVDVHDFAFDAAELDRVRDEIRRSMDAMRDRLADVDANRAEREAFPLTEDRTRCAVCGFRRLCGR